MVMASASARVAVVTSSINTGISAAGAYTARSETVVEAGTVADATAAAGALRADCDEANHVTGGTPASSTVATTAVRLFMNARLFMNQSLETGIASWSAACRTIEVLIGDIPRRRARSSDRSHRRLTVRGFPPENVAI